jgi:hypothetical protein
MHIIKNELALCVKSVTGTISFLGGECPSYAFEGKAEWAAEALADEFENGHTGSFVGQTVDGTAVSVVVDEGAKCALLTVGGIVAAVIGAHV